jgi:arylsulfatase A-like enzyme
MNNRPNILVIMTDQQSAHMMSCAGNQGLATPAIDRLAASGVRFERAYCTNPVCVPSRFSLQTGRMPSAIGMKWNEELPVPDTVMKQSLGALFHAADYETVYAGKVHLPGALKEMGRNGYRDLTRNDRQGLADSCAEFLKKPHERPFLLYTSFINPHDICYLAINDALRAKGQMPPDNIDSRTCEAVADEIRANISGTGQELTPLPANHAICESEPQAISTEYLTHEHQGAPYRRHAREEWQEREWRIYRHVYRKLTEKVDAQIGQVLDALREAGLEENTLVVFTSDHGDMDGAHKLQHKSVLYEEAVRIPFIMSHQGTLPQGVVDDEHLVSNGLDLLPTLCEAARIKCPDDLNGRSLLPLARRNADTDVAWRDYVVVESLHGRMLRTDRFKYSTYFSGDNREQLIDLKNDPGEMTNLAADESAREALEQHRQHLKAWARKTGDTIGLEYV